MRWRRCSGKALAAGPALALAQPAHAHLVSTGLGPIYDGIGHFLLSIETVLPLTALLLWAAMAGIACARRAALALPLLWLLAGLAGVGAGTLSNAAGAITAGTVMVTAGALAALDRPWPPLALAWASGALALGFAEGSALRALPGGALMVLGAGMTLAVLASVLAATLVRLSAGAAWRRVLLRVCGSWLAGSGLLLLGWQMRA